MKIIKTNKSPQAVGPYSQAIVNNNIIYVSGQIPFDPQTMKLVSEDVQGQTHQALKNLKGLLEDAGSSLGKVIKVNIFITDMDRFNEINEVYSQYFVEHKPTRSCVEVSKLPKNVQIEIECIANI